MPRAQIKDERQWRGGASKRYEDWTKRQLYRRAKEIGIEGRSQMNKKQLIYAIRHH